VGDPVDLGHVEDEKGGNVNESEKAERWNRSIESDVNTRGTYVPSKALGSYLAGDHEDCLHGCDERTGIQLTQIEAQLVSEALCAYRDEINERLQPEFKALRNKIDIIVIENAMASR